VDQYLLAFGRPEDTRMLVAPSLDLGVALVRMEAGQGARLAELADRFPGDGDGVVLAGSAVELALATRNGARGMLPWLALSLIWCTVLSGVLLRRRGEPAGALFAGLALPPAAASCSLVAGSCVLGSLSPLLLASACGVLILSSTALLLERSAAIGLLVTAGVGLAPMLLSSATELQAVAVAQGAGCLLAVLLCLPRRVAR